MFCDLVSGEFEGAEGDELSAVQQDFGDEEGGGSQPTVAAQRLAAQHIGPRVGEKSGGSQPTVPREVTSVLAEPDLSRVPDFDDNARGTANDWNYVQEKVSWGAKGYKAFGGTSSRPPRATTYPRISVIEKFLTLRLDEDGRPILHRLGPPQPKDNGWWCFPWIGADGLAASRVQQRIDAGWARAWHGTKLEALYSTMCDQRIAESRDHVAGERAFEGMDGIYCHGDGLRWKALHYIRFASLLPDGVVWAALWELYVDRDRVVSKRGKSTDQWVQQVGSVELFALWICGRNFAALTPGHEELSIRWDPLLEANPGIVRRVEKRRQRRTAFSIAL